MRHRIDLATQYCTRCGQSLAEIVERDTYDCEPAENVIPISHLVAGGPLRAAANKALERL